MRVYKATVQQIGGSGMYVMADTPGNVFLDRLPGGRKNILVGIPSGGESGAAERIIGDVAFEGVKERSGAFRVV